MAVRADGREAITHWEVVERYPGSDGKPVASLLFCSLETGRTHQIRVHLAAIGHPLLGDEVYGGGFKTKAARLAPSAARTSSSPSRRTERARIRLATFEQAMMKTIAAAVRRMSRAFRAGDAI